MGRHQHNLRDAPRTLPTAQTMLVSCCSEDLSSQSYLNFNPFSLLATSIFSDICFLVEFAFEIGSSLLTEVRRLQSLLGERDKAIQDMKEEKDDLDKAVEGLRTTLRAQEQNTGES